ARERRGAVQRERAEPPIAHLPLDLAAGPHEDGGGACLVDRHARAGNLRANGAPQRDQLSGGVDDRDHHAVPVLLGLPLGSLDDRLGTGLVDHASLAYGGHGQTPFSCLPAGSRGPVAFRTAAQPAVSVVMNRTFRRTPPNVKLTAPGRLTSPISPPSGLNTWTPANEDA